jgi:carboxymethylenebutenolidase
MKRFLPCALVFLLAAILSSVAGAASEADSVSRTAAAHANDEPVSTPAATTEPAQRVISRPAVYTKQGGDQITGWLSMPAEQPEEGLPALIVIHEWWGLNDNIRAVTERLAGEGYVALAVDLYHGNVSQAPKEAMKLMQGLNDEADAGRENLAAAYEYLASTTGAAKIGVVGWCLGGRWSLQAALRLPDQIDATVIYYGGVTDDKEQLATLQMPILGHFAATDPIVPPDTVVAFRDALAELGKDADIYIYPDTKHAFANPSGLAYNAVAADVAWERTASFLAENLQQSE